MIQVWIKAEKENSKKKSKWRNAYPSKKNFKGEKANRPLRMSLPLKGRKERNEWREF